MKHQRPPDYLGRLDAHDLAPRPPAHEPPSDWTPEWVDVRLTEAFETLMRLPSGRIGPATMKTVMPVFARDAADRDAQAESVDYERERKRFLSRKGLATPSEITRMEDALTWPLRYLSAAESVRVRAVCWSSFHKAVKRGGDKLHYRLGVSRRTFFRQRLKGLQTICDGLKRAGVPCT